MGTVTITEFCANVRIALLDDAEVKAWLAAMGALALLPEKR